MPSVAARIVEGGARALFALAALALALIVAVTAYEVAARYLLGRPTVWTSDATGVLLAWSIALAAPEVARRRGHVAITMLSDAGPWRDARARGLEALAALVCGGAAWIVATEAWRQFERGIATQGATPVPKAWITGAIALGLAWTALVFARLPLLPSTPPSSDATATSAHPSGVPSNASSGTSSGTPSGSRGRAV